jgi:hypothetical protein
MSNHTARTQLPPAHLRWWHCDHEGPGIEGCPVCRKVPDKGAAMWAAGLLRALDRESLALVGSLAAERDRERRRAEAAEAARAAVQAASADVGGLEYEGNSVEHWWRKAHAYKKQAVRLTGECASATKRAEAAEAALATARAEGAAAERAAVVRMLGKYRDHAEKLGLAAESVVLAEVLEVIDAEAHLDQPEGA